MTRAHISRFVFRSLIGIAALPIVQSSAQAIVINNTAGVHTAHRLGAPFTAVIELFLGDSQRCSGSLISPSYVLTAQHCIFGDSPSDFSVRFRDRDPLNTLLEETSVTSFFEVDPTNRVLDGTDIAILELSTPAPKSITPLRFLTNTDNLVGATVTTVGFGYNGVGSEGHQYTQDGRRWAAENILDWVGGAAKPHGGVIPESSNIFTTDFDDGSATNNTLSAFGSSALPLKNEGTTAPGDSGGPLLVNRNDEFLIAGVLSNGTTDNSLFSDISWWTGSELNRSFIERRGGQFVSAPEASSPFGSRRMDSELNRSPIEQQGGQFVSTPEASSPFALMMLGAVGVGVVWPRRRRLAP